MRCLVVEERACFFWHDDRRMEKLGRAIPIWVWRGGKMRISPKGGIGGHQ